MNQSEKEIFLEALARKSSFSFDVTHWISHVSKVLWACSGSAACSDHMRQALEKNGLWLAMALSFAPDHKETVHLLEAYQFTETLFDLAVEAHIRVGGRAAQRIEEMLLWWAFKGGKYEIGWATLEKALCGVIGLAVLKQTGPALEARLAAELVKPENALDPELRERAARELRRRVSHSWEYSGRALHISSRQCNPSTANRLRRCC